MSHLSHFIINGYDSLFMGQGVVAICFTSGLHVVCGFNVLKSHYWTFYWTISSVYSKFMLLSFYRPGQNGLFVVTKTYKLLGEAEALLK